MNILNKMAAIQPRSMSGAFNDMDMLEVGNGGQSDDEYKVHFSMWAMMSSPLLMGTNILTLTPANLAIYSNPAVIALNQDPSANAGTRKWRNVSDDGLGETSLWTRSLNNSDRVIALINAYNTSLTLNASMADIFLDEATAGSFAPPKEISEDWDVYDLWANRMSDDEAANVLNGTAPEITAQSNSTTRYNATALSYADGLNMNHTALFGKKVGQIHPGGQWSVKLDRHSIGLYRLRSAGSSSMRKRDEL